MGTEIERRIVEAETLISAGLTAPSTQRLLDIAGAPPMELALLEEARLYPEVLPKGAGAYSPEQRFLHLVWDLFEKSPLSIVVPFSIPFRRTIAGKLFRGCGVNFICERHVSFNFGQFLEVGRDVFFNSGVFLDTKGGVTIGDYSALAEDVRVFTHSHCEWEHSTRSYAPVHIGNYVKIFAGAMILPGVTIGDQAVVGGNAVVTKDVPANTLVGGTPAVPIRERNTRGRVRDELRHIWLHNGAFQEEA